MRLASTYAFLVTLAGCAGDLADPAPPEEEDPVVPAPGGEAVVLLHGLGGSPADFDPAIVSALEADGHAVLLAEVPPVESVAARAAALAPQLDAFLAQTGAARLHLIAHSMGGLDARHAISTLGYAPKVASLTTLGTPHHGSIVADVALGLVAGDQAAALDAIVQLVGDADPGALERALVDLSEAAAPAFNAANPDAPGVRYASFAGLSTPSGLANPNAAAACTAAAPPAPDAMNPLLVLPGSIVARGLERVPNDGLVAVASAASTGFAGCIAADHLDETRASSPTFDAIAFYRALVP